MSTIEMFFNRIRMPRHTTLLFAGILLAFFASIGQLRAAPDTPKHVIEGYYATLLETMRQGPKLGYKGRYDLLSPAVDKAFNIPVMAQQSVGSFWDQMTEDQRSALTA